jgi:uncharacterized membrane protein
MTDRATSAAHEGRTLPAIIYGLYLLGVANGATAVLGLVLALANRGGAGERMRTHYTFLIRSCWLWLAWMVIGILLLVVGAPLSLVLVGVPLLLLGKAIIGLTEAWFIIRVVLGAIRLARNEAYPRPYSWFW